MKNNLRSILNFVKKGINLIFARENKNIIFGLLVLTFILIINFQCVTNGKACDGDPTLDPNNNCLPFTSTSPTNPPVTSTNTEANKRCYENPPITGYIFPIETFDDLERLSFCSKLENSTDDYIRKWLKADYVILKDIDASGKTWNPIATSVEKNKSLPFEGTLKGQCGATSTSPCKISNLNINSSIPNSSNLAGLIGNADGAVIENLIFEQPVITVSNSGSTGVLIANLSNGGTISKIKLNNPKINSSNGNVGSLIGSITSNNFTTTISEVLVTELELTADGDQVGGLVGKASGLTLDLAKINVKVLTGGDSTGGLIGEATGVISLTNLYTNGTGITGKNNVGGLIGKISGITGKIESFYTAFDNPIKFSGTTSSITGGAGGIIGTYDSNLKIGYGFSANLLYSDVVGNTRVGGVIGYCITENNIVISAPIYFNQDATSTKGNVFGANCGNNDYVFPVSSVFLRDNLYEQLDIKKESGVEVSLKFNPKIWGAMGAKGSYPCLNELDSSSSFDTGVTSSSLSAPKICADNKDATIDYIPILSAFTTESKTFQCLSGCLNDYKDGQIYLNWTKNEDPSTNYKISLLKLDNNGNWNTVYFANSAKNTIYEIIKSENAYNFELTGFDYGIYKINLSACLDNKDKTTCANPTAPIQFILPSFSTNGDVTLSTKTLSNWNISTSNNTYRNKNWGNSFSDGDVTLSWSSSSNIKYYKIGIKIWGKDVDNPNFLNSQTGDMKCIFSNFDNSNNWKVDVSRFNNVKDRNANESFCKTFTNISSNGLVSGNYEVKLNATRAGINFSVYVAPCKNTCGVWGVASNNNSNIVTSPFENENSNTSKIVLTLSSTSLDIQNGNIKLSYNLTQLRDTPYSLVLLEKDNASTSWSTIKTLDNISSSNPISISKNLSGNFNYKIKPCTIINDVNIACGKESDELQITINSVGVVADVWSTVNSNYINSFIQDRANKSSTLYVGSSGRKFDLIWSSIKDINTEIRYEIEEVNSPTISWFSVIDKNGKYINSKKQLDGYTCDKGVCTLKFKIGLLDNRESDNITFNIRACRDKICDANINTFTLTLERISLPDGDTTYNPNLYESINDQFNSIKVNSLGHIEIPKYCHNSSGGSCKDGQEIDKPNGVDFYQIGVFNENNELLTVNSSSLINNRNSIDKSVSLGLFILPLGKLKFKLRFCVNTDGNSNNQDDINCSDWSIDSPSGGFTPKIPINLSVKSINGADITQIKTGEEYVLAWQSLEKIDKFLVTQTYVNDDENFEKNWLISKSNNNFTAKLINDDTCIEPSANCKVTDFPKVTWLSVKEDKINLVFRNIGWATYTYTIQTCPNSVNNYTYSSDCINVSNSKSLLVTISTVSNFQISTNIKDGGTVKNNDGTYNNYSTFYKITWDTIAKTDEYGYFYRIKEKYNSTSGSVSEFEIDDLNANESSYINDTNYLPGNITYSIYTCTLVGCNEQASNLPKISLEIRKAGTVPRITFTDNNVTLTYSSVMGVGGYWNFGNTGYAFTTGNDVADLKFKWKSVEGYKDFVIYWKTADQDAFVKNGTISEGLPLLTSTWNTLKSPVSGSAFIEKSILWYTSSISKIVIPKSAFGFIMRYCFYDCETEATSNPNINWSNAYKVKVYQLAKADATGFYMQDVDALKINFYPNLIINNKNSIFSTNPLLNWMYFNSANSYNLSWSSNNGLTWSDIKNYTANSNNISYPSGNYTFRLQPCDANGTCGAWSETRNINIKTTCDENDPDKEIPSYTNGSTDSFTNCSVVNNTKVCKPISIDSSFNFDTKYYSCNPNRNDTNLLILSVRGDGSINKPFLLYNVAHLQAIRNSVDSSSNNTTSLSTPTVPTIYYKLAQNINAANSKPLNTIQKPFTGSLDGANLLISSLKITGGGIFSEIGNVGVIKNIIFKNIESSSGLLANTNWGTIKEVGVHSIKIIAPGSTVGGLVNTNNTGGTISRSYVRGVVNGGIKVGGIAGLNLGTIDNSYSLGSVRGLSRVGGLVGQNGTKPYWDVYACKDTAGNYYGDEYLSIEAGSSASELNDKCSQYNYQDEFTNALINVTPVLIESNVKKQVEFNCRGKEVSFERVESTINNLTHYTDKRKVGTDAKFHSGLGPVSDTGNFVKFCNNKAKQTIENYTTNPKENCPYDGYQGTCKYNNSYEKVHSTKKWENRYDSIYYNTNDGPFNSSLDTYLETYKRAVDDELSSRNSAINTYNSQISFYNTSTKPLYDRINANIPPEWKIPYPSPPLHYNVTHNYDNEAYMGIYKSKAFYCIDKSNTNNNTNVLSNFPFYVYSLKTKDRNNNTINDSYGNPIVNNNYYNLTYGTYPESDAAYGKTNTCKFNYGNNAVAVDFSPASYTLRTWRCYTADYNQVGSVDLPSGDSTSINGYNYTNNNIVMQMCSKQTGTPVKDITNVDYQTYDLAPTTTSSGSISNSYSAAVVKGSGLVGGLLGIMANEKVGTSTTFKNQIVNSFWDKQVSGQSNGCNESAGVGCSGTAGVITGLSSEKNEKRRFTFYKNWSFSWQRSRS